MAAILGLGLVATIVLWRFPVMGECYLATDILKQFVPYKEAGAPRPKNPLDSDPVLCTFPRAASVGASLRAGKGAPRWEPGLGCGEPLALVNATAPDYLPWRLAYTWLPAWAAHATTILLHLWLAMAGTFFLARARGASPGGSLVAALVYGLSGHLQVWLEHELWVIAAAWTPWALLAVHRGRPFLAALALGLAILGGHLQIAALGIVAAFFYALPRSLKAAAILSVGALLVGSARLVPATVDLLESARERIPFERWHAETASLKLSRLPALVGPDLAGDPIAGVVLPRGENEAQANPQEIRFSPGVALLLVVVAAAFRKNRWLTLAGVALIVLAMPTYFGIVVWLAPGFGSTAPTRVLALFPLVAALLAADGFSRRDAHEKFLSVASVLAVVLLLHWRMDRAMLKPLVLLVLALAAIFTEGRVRGALLVALVAFDLVEATVRWNPTGKPEDLYPRTSLVEKAHKAGKPTVLGAPETIDHQRVVADRGVPPDILLPIGLRGVGSYGSSHPGRFAQLVDTLAPPLDAARSRQWLYARRLPPAWRDFLGVRAVLSDDRGPSSSEDLARVTSELSTPTFQRGGRTHAQPANRVLVVETREAALQALRELDPFDPLVIERTSDMTVVNGRLIVPPRTPWHTPIHGVVLDEPERVIVHVNADEHVVLVLADAWAHGWTARLTKREGTLAERDLAGHNVPGGKPCPIAPANLAFRAVVVPPGDHAVTFEYSPPGWPFAPIVSVIAVVIFFLREWAR